MQVNPVSQPIPDATYEGYLNSSYDSIENGEIVLETNEDASILTIQSIKGNLVGDEHTEGMFEIDDPSLFGDIEITSNKFSAVAVNGEGTIEISGAISGEIASGIVIYQMANSIYIGAFSAFI